MTDPRRLLDDGADEFEAKLLRAGRADAPTSRNRRRVAAGLGLGGILSTSAVAASVKATASGWSSVAASGALRWVGGGAVSALAVWAGVTAASPDPVETLETSAPVTSVAPSRAPTAGAAPTSAPSSPPAPGLTAPAVSAKPLVAKSALAPRSAPSSTVPQANTDSLSAELSALEEARAALGRQGPALALRLLDDYTRRFPKRRLDTEATVLRIEALAMRGDRALASRIGNEFLARQPNGPYARRVSSLIGERASTKAAP